MSACSYIASGTHSDFSTKVVASLRSFTTCKPNNDQQSGLLPVRLPRIKFTLQSYFVGYHPRRQPSQAVASRTSVYGLWTLHTQLRHFLVMLLQRLLVKTRPVISKGHISNRLARAAVVLKRPNMATIATFKVPKIENESNVRARYKARLAEKLCSK